MTSTITPPTLGQAVEQALLRLKTVWRRHEWTPNLVAEYRRVLLRIGSAESVGRAVDAAIEKTAVNYPPPPGAFATIGAEVEARHSRPARNTPSRSTDEGALIDALAYLDQVRGTPDEEYTEGMVTSIRRRLPDFGAAAEDRTTVRFEKAEPYRYDPPGTVRFKVIQPGSVQPSTSDQIDMAFGSEEPFPRGPLNGGS